VLFVQSQHILGESIYIGFSEEDWLPRTGKFKAPVNQRAIAKRLRELRKRSGLTQVELATKVGISQALLSEYERGEVRIHGELVAAFAKTLRVSSDELLGLKTPKHNGFFPDRRFLRRLQKIEQLSRRDKQALLKTIDGYLKGAGVD